MTTPSESTTAATPTARVRIHVLGRFSVEVDGAPLRFSRRAPQKPLELLKALIALGGDGVSAETLGDALWPEAEGDQALNALHTTVSRLRQLIGPDAVTMQFGRLTLAPDQCWVDAFACAEQLEQALRRLDAAQTDAAHTAVRAALDGYRGPLLEGEFAPAPVLSARTRLHDGLLRAVERTGAALDREQRHDEAMLLFRSALERDDQAEPLHQGLMRVCLATGRVAEGLAAYERCRRVLETALSAEPSAETEQLRQALADFRGSAAAGEPAAGGRTEAGPARLPTRQWWMRVAAGALLAAAIAALGVGSTMWWLGGQPAESPGTASVPGEVSIAVLAFESLSGDAEQEYFGDGIADSILTALVRIPKMRVVARNSSFAYKGRNMDVRQIGRELEVQYVVEGSVLRSGARLRITAQLIDAQTGKHLWARSYDRELESLLDVIDDITHNVFIELGVLLVYGEAMRSGVAGTRNPEAYDKVLRAVHEFSRFHKDANAAAIRLANEAVKLDPHYANAMALLGWAHLNDARIGWAKDRRESFRQAAAWARRSVETDPDCAVCLGIMSRIRTEQGHHEEAIALSERALGIEPGNAHLHQQYAHSLIYAGEPERALAPVQEALRRMPIPTLAVLAAAGEAYFLLGRYEESRPHFERMLAMAGGRGFQALSARLHLIAVHVAGDRQGEARALAAEFLAGRPGFNLRRFRKGLESWSFRDRTWFEPWIELLRRAGLPE